jgi:hypothetical protein
MKAPLSHDDSLMKHLLTRFETPIGVRAAAVPKLKV